MENNVKTMPSAATIETDVTPKTEPETATAQETDVASATSSKQGEKLNFAARCSAFFEKNYALFFAPFIVLVLYFTALYQYDAYPFGKGYLVASYDLSAQICPFIEHLFDVLDGKSTLNYSYAIAGGADVTGTFLYFFISPFSFLFLIFGDGKVTQATFLVMACKLMAVSIAGAWFAKKQFKGIPDYIAIAVGVVYTYCGYMFIANTYINWVDFLIYMPFCVGAFRHFVNTNKFLPFSILMACCIYTCFSIASFSLFLVFPILIVYALLCVEKERRNQFIAYLAMAFLVAILISLPVLLPALGAYANGARSGDAKLLDDFWKGFKDKTADMPQNFDSSWYIENVSTLFYKKWSYIFSDAVFLCLTLIWFYRKGFKDRFAQFMLVAGVITMIPNIVDEAMVLLNLGPYMQYSLRFGFLNAIYFLGGACLCLDSLCYKEGHAFDGTPLYADKNGAATKEQNEPTVSALNETLKENEGGVYALNVSAPDKQERERNSEKDAKSGGFSFNAWTWAIMVIGFFVAASLFYFLINENYKSKDFWKIFTNDSTILSSVSGFSASFAHTYGGMEIVLVLFAGVALVTVIGACFVGAKKISVRLLSIILIVVLSAPVLLYNNTLVTGNIPTSGGVRSYQDVRMDSFQELCDVLNENDDGYFRVKDYSDDLPANAPFTGGVNGFSVFSSVIDSDNFVIGELFGYYTNSKNSLKSWHNNKRTNHCYEFGDSFLGYKYYFVPVKEKDHFQEGKTVAKYVKPYMVTDENGNETQLQSGDYVIYENEIVFPMGFLVDSGEYRFVATNNTNPDNRKKNQQALYKFLRGKDLADMKEETGSNSSQFVTPETARELSNYLRSRAADVQVGAGKITARVDNDVAGRCLMLSFVASKGYTVTVNGKAAKLVDNDLKFLVVELPEGEDIVVEFTYKSPYMTYMAYGVIAAIVGLCAVAFIVKKTKLVEWASPVIAWAGIGLATALVAFFLLYPTCGWAIKVLKLIL